jgi:hypothetical protein
MAIYMLLVMHSCMHHRDYYTHCHCLGGNYEIWNFLEFVISAYKYMEWKDFFFVISFY